MIATFQDMSLEIKRLLTVALFLASTLGQALAESGKPYDFVALNQSNAPVQIPNANLVVSDSRVGNQDYYAMTCYLARNVS